MPFSVPSKLLYEKNQGTVFFQICIKFLSYVIVSWLQVQGTASLSCYRKENEEERKGKDKGKEKGKGKRGKGEREGEGEGKGKRGRGRRREGEKWKGKGKEKRRKGREKGKKKEVEEGEGEQRTKYIVKVVQDYEHENKDDAKDGMGTYCS